MAVRRRVDPEGLRQCEELAVERVLDRGRRLADVALVGPAAGDHVARAPRAVPVERDLLEEEAPDRREFGDVELGRVDLARDRGPRRDVLEHPRAGDVAGVDS